DTTDRPPRWATPPIAYWPTCWATTPHGSKPCAAAVWCSTAAPTPDWAGRRESVHTISPRLSPELSTNNAHAHSRLIFSHGVIFFKIRHLKTIPMVVHCFPNRFRG